MGNDVNILDNQGPDFKMNYQMKLIALEIMLTRFPAIFESIERTVGDNVKDKPEDKFNTIFSNLKAYAVKKRWEAQHKKGKAEPLKVDEVPWEEPSMMQVWVEDGYGGYVPQNVNVDALGKRKRKEQRKR